MLIKSNYRQQLFDEAEKQRKLCHDWLLSLMAKSREKPATKEALCAEAMRRWKVSRNAFDGGWGAAIEETGNHHWYQPGKRGQRIIPKSD